MAAEEDRKFDAVLGGFLVNNLRVRAGHPHCPESDLLAAYHERSLLPEQMNSWKEHIVGCARCQAILSELEATDSISLQAREKEEILAKAAQPVPVPSQNQNATGATVQKKPRVISISRGVRWQWLVPAGALAAGLLVWVASHENRSLQVRAPAEAKTAKLEPPATLPPSVARDDRQAASADEVARVSKDQGALGGAVPAKPSSEAKNLKQFEKSDSRARVALSEPQADKETGARADRALDSMAAASRAQNQPAQDAKAGVAGAVSETVQVQTLTANAQTQNQQELQNLQAQQNQLNDQKVSGPNPSRHADLSKKAKSESHALHRAAATPAAQPPPPPTAPAAFNDSAALRMAAVVSPSVIAAPGGKTLWRGGHAGMIEFSNDGGTSWSRQVSNVFADLTAGSAPSDKVCWIVGRAGTILLTTDAGAHWATLRSPLAEDLGGIHATDALHAIIWNFANTRVFETTDGGITWQPAASQ